MAEKKKTTNTKKNTERAMNPVERAVKVKEELLRNIESIDVDVPNYNVRRDNINKLYKIRAGVFAADFSNDRDVNFTILSSGKTKEFVELAEKIDGVLGAYNYKAEQLTKEGKYSELTEAMSGASEFVSSIEKALVEVNKNIEKSLEKGIGSRRDLEDFRKAARLKLINAAADLISTGILPSKAKEKLEIEDVSIVDTARNKVLAEYLEVNKEEILKEINSGKSLQEIADKFEVKPANLNNIYKENLPTYIELIKPKIVKMVNDKVKFMDIVSKLNVKQSDIIDIYNEAIPSFIDSNKSDIAKLIKEKVSAKEIANQLGLSVKKFKPFYEEFIAALIKANKTKIIKDLANLTSYVEMAETYGIPSNYIVDRVKEWAAEDDKVAKALENRKKVTDTKPSKADDLASDK